MWRSAASFKDPLPASAHYTSATPSQGTCTRSASAGNRNKEGTVTCSPGNLAAGGGSATVTIVIAPTKAGTLTDTATGTATNVSPPDGDDSAAATVTVQRA